MTPDRLRQVTEIFHAALAREPAARIPYLTAACQDDASLRDQVEVLLAQAEAEGPRAEPRQADENVAAEDRPSAALIGSAVGPYEVLAQIGAGGMGDVFLGHDSRLKRKVALKCLSVRDADRGRRILHEARAAAQLNHPNIAAVYDVFEQEGRPFIVMEFVEGRSLRDRLEQGPLPLGEVLSIGRHLASALAAAHERGVIHRDLKPGNVQVMPDGQVKVLDFGVAVMTGGLAPSDQSTVSVGLPNASLQLAGTPAYMAPEQLLLGQADARSDIYSLGLILFEMATGKRPYEADDRLAQIIAVASEPAPQASTASASVPRALSDVIARALEREPQKRFESAAAMEQALAEVEESGWRAFARRPLRSSMSRWAIGGAIAAIAVTAGVLSWRPLVERVTGRSGAGGRPAILAVLPPAIPTATAVAEQVGTALTSLVSQNFRAVPGLEVVSREVTAPYVSERANLERLGREVGASHVLDLTVRAEASSIEVIARLRRPGSAVPEWEKVMTGDAVAVEKMLLDGLGDALDRQGIRPRSAAERRAIAKLPTARADALMAYLEARALLDYSEIAGNTQRAVTLLEQATSTDGRFALAHAGLADALRARFATERDPKLLARAAAEARTALEVDPDESAAHTAFAAVEHASGRRDAAATSLRRALDLQPDNDEAHRLLGRILAEQDHVDEGVARLRTAIQLRPTAFTHYHTLGFVLYTAGRYAEALEVYRKAAEVRPQHAVAYQMMGVNAHAIGDIDQAIGNYEHAVRIGPTATAYANLAVEYFAAGRYDKALTAVGAAIARDPKKATLQRDLGDIYLRLGRRADAHAAYGRAIAMARAALSVDPRDAFSIVLIGLCEAGLGRPAEAEQHATEAMALAPRNHDVLFRAAKIFALTGDSASALSALRRAIERGYASQLARRDPELASLRPLPEFERVLSAKPPGRGNN